MPRQLAATPQGSPVTVTIDKLIHGGRGMGRLDGMPIFVEGALAGERVDVVITRVGKGYLEGRAIRIVQASADRVPPPCEFFGVCGGCQIQHLAYAAQLEGKRGILAESLRRLGGITVDVSPLHPSPELYGYRLRAGLQVRAVGGQTRLGFYAAKSHTVVPVTSCAVLHPRLQAAIPVLRDVLERGRLNVMGCEAIELQTTSAAEELLIVLHLRKLDRNALGTVGRELQAVLPLRGLVAYDRRHHRWVGGTDSLDEQIDGVRCRVSDRTFLQINAGVNEALVSTVITWADLKGNERVVDLYAGFGNLSLPLAARAHRTIAIESTPSAVADARVNARQRGVTLTVAATAVESWAPAPTDLRPELLVVDPPRGGLSPRAMERILTLAPARMLYVSCEPATLARDARRLVGDGYRVARVAGFDLFPHTAHMETIAELVRS